VSILQLNSQDLITLFKTLFDLIRQPPTLMRRVKEEKLKLAKSAKTDAKSTEKK
jgi:hypothetical protein